MTTYPKRLIEVDLPIKRISAHARREKSIRHGHISTLHIWWARRPLAACRAVILAALWPDPADPLCPERFRKEAAKTMKEFQDRCGGTSRNWKDPLEVRAALLDFIADFANWDNSTNPNYLEPSRHLVQVAHESLGGAPGTRPLVVDPFAGGGAIPLEALRVGADAFASDLNPVAVLLNKVVLEYIPKYGQRLADEVRKWGEWVKKEAEKELAEFYPKDPDGATPIAYLWARTIKCEGPGCGAEVPLVKSLWLGKKPHNAWSLRIVPNKKQRRIAFEIVQGAKPREVGEGTIGRGSATCPCCGYTTPVKSVREQLKARRGGTTDARLFCVVTTKPRQQGRFYRLPTTRDLNAVKKAAMELTQRKAIHKSTPSLIPDEVTPRCDGHRAVASTEIYGLDTWGDFFTSRQLLTLTTLVNLVKMIRSQCDDQAGLATAVQTCLALNIDKMADYGSSLASWSSPASQETVRGTFSRQALAMVWDFAEAYPFVSSSGGWMHNLAFLVSPIEAESQCNHVTGHVERTSATEHPMPDNSAQALVTDPPYYDAVPYADLSDFMYVWLKRSIGEIHTDLFRERLTPKKTQAVVWHPNSLDEKREYELKMFKSMEHGQRVLVPWGIGLVVFAHKSTSGWESQLESMLKAGWIISASWPVDTERGGRMNAVGTASLASSIHLVCRPRENPDGSLAERIGDWRDVLAELPRRIHDWMPRLAAEGVVGADAIFACLGPALEIFSRYSRVEKPDGSAVTLKEYLERVWAAVSQEALGMVFGGADTGGFEEDARLTAMWLWTLGGGLSAGASAKAGNGSSPSATVAAGDEDDASDDDDESKQAPKPAGFTLEYDAARKIAQGLGAHLDDIKSVVEVKGDKARLLPVKERAEFLFGKPEGSSQTAGGSAKAGGRKKKSQASLFEEIEQAEEKEFWGDRGAPEGGKTVLDRVHQSMILFAAGRSEALKRFLVDEGIGRDDRFWRLAQALAALYPPATDERRWVEGVMARKKGLGF